MAPADHDVATRAQAFQIVRESYVAKLKQDLLTELDVLREKYNNDASDLEGKSGTAIADAEAEFDQHSQSLRHQEDVAIDFCTGKLRQESERQMADLQAELYEQAPHAESEANGGTGTKPVVLKTRPSTCNVSPASTTAWWSDPMTEIQRRALIEKMKNLKEDQALNGILKPVDPIALNIPSYFEIIKHPMDLYPWTTI